MRTLVTGANGLIGANLIRALLGAGHKVVGLVRPTADCAHIAHLPIRIHIGDVHDLRSLKTAMIGCDWVFHTAVHFSYWGKSPEDLSRTAVEGTRNVLTAALGAGVRRVVMTSSSVTLGAGYVAEARDEGHRADEDISNESAYVRAKIEQEREALSVARRLGVETVVACPTMCIGPFGAALGPSNGVITSYLADPLRLTWAGGCNIVSTRDVAQGHILLAERGAAGERYVLGSENMQWRDVHRTIAELAGVAAPGSPASATICYWAALAEEAKAKVTGKPPLATRAQARMVGRFYWYSHDRAARIGYAPGPARAALAEALAWLAPSRHVSRDIRARMRLDRSVHRARAAIAAGERELTGLRV
jgi:dihydroflavonol-4-reductase